jgi:iron-sulfur cluster repair protein YtfE (RIC family)
VPTVQRLANELEAHLMFEETVVFPAIRLFSRAWQQSIRDAMRARRERKFAHDLRVAG